MNHRRERRLVDGLRLVLLFAGLVCTALYLVIPGSYLDPKAGTESVPLKILFLSIIVGITLPLYFALFRAKTTKTAGLENEDTEALIIQARLKDGREARSILANRYRNGDQTAREWFFGEMPSGPFDDQIRIVKRSDERLKLHFFRLRRHRHRSLKLHFYRARISLAWIFLSCIAIFGTGLFVMQFPRPYGNFGIVVVIIASRLIAYPFDRHWFDSSIEDLTVGELYALWIEGDIRDECEGVLRNRISNQAIWIRKKLCL